MMRNIVNLRDDTMSVLRRHLEEVIEQAQVGLAEVGPDHVIRYCNPMFASILGRTRDQVVGHTWMEFTHPEDIEEDYGLTERVKRGEINMYDLHKRYLQPDGTHVNCVLRVVGVRNGKFVGFWSSIQMTSHMGGLIKIQGEKIEEQSRKIQALEDRLGSFLTLAEAAYGEHFKQQAETIRRQPDHVRE